MTHYVASWETAERETGSWAYLSCEAKTTYKDIISEPADTSTSVYN
jgi:hypothetical protein